MMVAERLQGFTAGRLEDFEALFREYQGPVYRWIAVLVRDPAAAEDLTIETFWRIWRARAHFDARREFGAWARRIASNLALNHLRRAPRTVALAVEPRAAEAADPETGQKVRAAFGALPVKLRAVAALALIEERPQAEIAAALGISVSAVKSREFRAVRLLRRKLSEMGLQPCIRKSAST
jgi:RNA polymerase sigma-70 factor (ECF subfamily)